MRFIDTILFSIIFSAAVLSISATYYRYLVLEDYEVFLEFDADGNIFNIDQ